MVFLDVFKGFIFIVLKVFFYVEHLETVYLVPFYSKRIKKFDFFNHNYWLIPAKNSGLWSFLMV